MFPADDVDKLEELSFAIKLVYLIVECQHEVRTIGSRFVNSCNMFLLHRLLEKGRTTLQRLSRTACE